MIRYLLILFMIGFIPQGFADQGTGSTSSETTQQTYAPQGSSGQSNNAMMQQMLGAGMSAATGAQLSSICGTPSGQWACPMAAMSFAQAAMMLMSAGKSGNTMDYSSSYTPPDLTDLMTDTPGFEDTGVGTTPQELDAFISEGTNSLGSSGWSFDPATGVLSTPDGDFTLSEEDMSSAAALQKALGGSASDMKLAESTAQSLASDLAKKFGAGGVNPSVSGVAVDSSGGGGGSGYGSRRSGSGGSGSGLNDYFAALNRKPSSASKEQMIAGKSKLLGKDNIGISVDNIFKMVHRRYQAKRKSNNFLEPIITEGTKRK